MNTKTKKIIDRVIYTTITCFCLIAIAPKFVMAYYETHPPYQFKQGPYRHVPDKPLSDKDIPLFIKKNIDSYSSTQVRVYQIDVDGNGMKDFISFIHPATSPLLNEIHIYLQKPEGSYQEISLSEDAGAGIEDIVDINNDGEWEVILTNLVVKGHSYFLYSVYEFKDYRLVNANKKFKGFPKFVQYTHKNNDKDTSHFSKTERNKFVNELDRKIQYQLIQPQ